ncbi:MAG TPA: hypothetical protein VFP63_01175 [Dehalococcoidia bacterium]|nr:hypothetical protein [Dehalococcoidia bacterium]
MRARAWLLPLLLLALPLAAVSAAPDRTVTDHLCSYTGSPAGAYDFETYEELDYRYVYGKAMELAGLNQLLPDVPGFAPPALESGDRSAGSGQVVPAYIPPVLLKAIAWIESGWAQASYDPLVQYGEVGPTLISHDCGYGIMQITTGMQNVNDVPSLEQAMIGGNYAFNIARGARILAEKWNAAPDYRPLIGNRDPHIIENWYYALWGYNGFVWGNHPLNPKYNPGRGLYDCVSDRSGYPYQELVLGCVANPPWRGGVRLWDPMPVHLPDLNDPQFAGPLSTANWEACAYSLDCAGMDMPTPNPYHTDPSSPGIIREQLLGNTQMQVSQDVITMNPSGGQVQVSVHNPAGGTLSWRATSTAPWVRSSRVQGISISVRSSAFVVTVDTSGLPPGNHTAQIVLESLWATPPTRVIQIQVQEPCQPTGSIDAADALQILRQVAGLPACTADIGDANCNGGIDAVDALAVLRYVAGLPSGVPPGCPPLG